jgi:hypothetical protein
MHASFTEFALLLLICAVVGAIFVRLRQPVLIAYIVVGIGVGPAGLELVTAHDQIDLLAQVGVAVLLFAVGLKLDLHHVRHIGPVALATGLGQLSFTIVIGFGLILALGKSAMEAVYVAVALTFSSTIIIVKLLSDKRELDSLHGRIAVGFLIVQDLAVVVAMMAMSALRDTGDAESNWVAVLASLAWRLTAAAVAMAVLMRWVLPAVVAAMARSQELLLVFAVAWGVALAALGEWAGFSKEAGAFLAGFRQQNHVAVQRHALTMQQDQRHERRHQIVLVVQRAAPVDPAAVSLGTVGREGPFAGVHVHRVLVRHQQQRALAAIATQAGHDVGPAFLEGKHLVVDALGVQHAGDVAREVYFTAGWICCVDAHHGLEVLQGFGVDGRPVEGLCEQGGGTQAQHGSNKRLGGKTDHDGTPRDFL